MKINQGLINTLNYYGKKMESILFVIDYKIKNFYISPTSNLPLDVKYEIDSNSIKKINKEYFLDKQFVSLDRYQEAFEIAKNELINGNSYLLNLTFPTFLNTNLSLDEIYKYSNAKFKLKFFNKFVCFSPERFVKISNNKIETYPMKGTIDYSIKNARKIILSNKKEMAEHTMIVDLLRNDLAIVSEKIDVEKFRYIQKIKAGERDLLQVSSKITGKLEKNWQNRLGEIITSLLPAGSITGTPKLSTTNIIEKIEKYDRGYFAGIFGVFDGESLDSAVMIRFVEQTKNGFFYKSGGGITIDSILQDEYDEMSKKVYFPFQNI